MDISLTQNRIYLHRTSERATTGKNKDKVLSPLKSQFLHRTGELESAKIERSYVLSESLLSDLKTIKNEHIVDPFKM